MKRNLLSQLALSLVLSVSVCSAQQLGRKHLALTPKFKSNKITSAAAAAPANDDCSGAITLTAGTSCSPTSGDATGATQSIAPIACNGSTSSTAMDVWYKFVAINAKQTIKLTGTTDFDAVLELFGSCGGASISCADISGQVEILNATGLTVGSTYYVRAYDWGSFATDPTFDICVYTTPAPPANDNCAGAISVTVAANSGACSSTPMDFAGATTYASNPSCLSTAGFPDMWYSFIATSTKITANISNTLGITGSAFVLYNTCGGAEVACNNGSFTGLTVGNTYILQVIVDGPGTADLCLFDTPPPPVNDECAGAISISVASSQANCSATTVVTLGATNNTVQPSCLTGNAPDLWYKFVATSTTELASMTNVTGITAKFLVLYNACGGTEVACNSTTFSGLTIGQTYYLQLLMVGQGSLDLCVYNPPPPPANDECAGAITIPVATSQANCSATTVNTAGATNNTVQPSCVTGNAPDMWYKFTATSSTLLASMTNVTGITTKVLVLYNSCGGTQVACNSTTFSGLTIGNTYYIQLLMVGQGSLDLCVYQVPPPANDECAGAITITPSTSRSACVATSANTTTATKSSTPAISCSSTSYDDDVWYKFNATAKQMVVRAYNKVGFSNLGMTMYAGSCSGTQTPECSAIVLGDSSVFSNLTVGTMYYLRMFTTNTNQRGTFDICVYPFAGVANDDCNGAITLTSNLACNFVNGDLTGTTESMPASNCNGITSSGANDSWYKFVATDAKTHIKVKGNLDFVPVIELFASCGGTSLGCAVDTSSLTDSLYVTNLTVGTTYYTRVYAMNNAALNRTFSICVTGGNVGIRSTASNGSLDVYPNPTHGSLKVKYSGLNSQSLKLQITDIKGQLNYQQIVTSFNGEFAKDVDVSNLSKGIYLLQIITDSSVMNRKIVVE